VQHEDPQPPKPGVVRSANHRQQQPIHDGLRSFEWKSLKASKIAAGSFLLSSGWPAAPWRMAGEQTVRSGA
jgi:hypothetical protein